MSSEEMRAELEIFVNEGLREGRRGWPLKSESHKVRPCGNRPNVTSLRLRHGGRINLARLTRRQGLFAISA